ncbi:GNAT family N-acetyltransferase [Granulosicoccus sp. 3-233]|uniref:GNAT family N-acetyltransferase n=1 Tax=Granulosicoccus sp. 3-233 TaxID=3417969 RepID=UPI003D330ECD
MTTDCTLSFHHLQPGNASLLKGAAVFDNPVDRQQLAAFVADCGHRMVFATLGEEVVGMASGTVLLHPDKQPAFFINEVGVIDAMRGRGIGARLVQMLMQEARDSGCQGIWLATETDNLAARALYSKLDARLTETVVVYDWDGAMDDETGC